MRARHASLRRLFDVLDDLVDDQVGVVRCVQEVRREPGAPEFFHYSAVAANTAAFTAQENFRNTGGASTRRDIAIAKAVGEAVERYSSAIFEVEEFPLHAAEDAPFKCVDPASFALYSDAQYDTPGFPWVRFDETTTVRWVGGVNPHTGEVVYVPAAFVWMPYHYYRGSGDTPIVQPISTGMACHCSPAEAACSGLGEVVERDAVMIFWQGKLSCPQVRVETLSDANYDLVHRFEATGDSVVLLNITTDLGIPCVLSVLRSRSPERAAFVFAASSDLDPEIATRKALEELAHTRRYSQQIQTHMARMAPDPTGRYEAVEKQLEHLNFYCGQENAHLAEFALASKERLEFDEIPSLSTGTPEGDLRVFGERLAAAGHTPVIVPLTSPDIAELGLHVVRAVVPGLHPLFMGHKLRALGGRRLWEVPGRMGHPQITRESGDNPAPHPYP